MNTKRKIGIVLILLGIAIPLVVYFFQENDTVFTIVSNKSVSRKLTGNEISAIKERLAAIKRDAENKVPKPPLDFLLDSPKETDPSYQSYLRSFLNVYKADLVLSFQGKDDFSEIWLITEHRRIEIAYRKIIGLGIMLIFIGLSFIIFSFSKKRTV